MVSILLPSLREELVKQRVKEWVTNNPNTDFEIIVVSPFKIVGEHVLWTEDYPPFKGSVFATNLALSRAKGDYIIYFSDDVAPTKLCLKNMLEFMKDKPEPFLGAFKMFTPTGKEIGAFGAYKKLYACYGCLSRNTLLKLSNILFRPEFKYSWADIDLSLRVWELGGQVEICPIAGVIPKQVEDEVYRSHRTTFDQDFNTFANKWHPKYSKDIPREIGAINRRLK